jgi:simple sugar transport system ATP-binding protein
MRKGELVGTVPTATVSREDLARMMVGRSVLLNVINPPQPQGKAVLEITNISYRTPKGAQRLNKLNLKVHEGEIYGIAGVEGNGQSELLSVLWGMQGKSNRVSGSVTVDGRNLIGLRPSEISDAGVSLIPEDRLKTALVAEYSIRDNLIFGRQREQRFHRRGGFDRHAVENHAKEMIEAFDIRCSVRENPSIASLSGGNQQKIVLAREIERPGLRLLVLAQPTRGVDIGAIELIHRKIIEARQKGFAILLVSSELEEIISLSTRIGCLFKGTISREYTAVEVLNGRSAKEEFEKQIGLHIT